MLEAGLLKRFGEWLLTLTLLVLLTGALLVNGTERSSRPELGLVGWRLEEPLPEHRVLRLLFGGDVMLARRVRTVSRRHADYAWPFREISGLTNSADIFFVNLESLFSPSPRPDPPHLLFQLSQRSLEALSAAGVDVVSLANNHTGDVGPAGVTYSRKLLEAAGIAACGAGADITEAHRPAILEAQGHRVAYLAYTSLASLTAGHHRPGHSAWGLELLERDIAALPGDVDLIVVSHHGGVEYASRPTELQRAFARRAVELGADVVVGHHPHVLQPLEVIGGSVALHSLGNLAMDQPWNPLTEKTALVELRTRGGVPRRLIVHPLRISAEFQPLPAGEETADWIGRRLGLPPGQLVLELNAGEP